MAVNFSDGICFKVIRTIEKNPELLELVRKKRYRVSDTELSYRQINSLEASDVLEDTRADENGWRLFSLKDLLYLKMIAHCRKYGVTNDKLKELKNEFYFDKEDSELFKSPKFDLYYGEYAIIASLAGIRVGWLLFEDGKEAFTDVEGLVFFSGSVKPEFPSYIYLNINELLIETFKGSRIAKVIPTPPSFAEIINSYMKTYLSEKEIEILNILRTKDYTKITIIKKEGGVINVYGGTTKDTKDLSETELLELFQERDFSNIKVQKRDGKIVTYEIEDVYKF